MVKSLPNVPSFRVDLACKLAINSVKVVTIVDGNRKEIDIKRYAKVEKVG